MTLIVTGFPVNDGDDPAVWRVSDGEWISAGALSDFITGGGETAVLAVIAPSDARCVWSPYPDLEPKQAEGVARIRAAEHSVGPVHVVARYLSDDMVVTAIVAPSVMEYGLSRLALRGLNPDIVIPVGLAIEAHADHVARAEFGGMAVLRGPGFAVPDEPVFRDLLIGANVAENINIAAMQAMLFAAGENPPLNLREGMFAKREPRDWGTANQRKWLKRLAGGLLAATLLLAIVTWVKLQSAITAENDRALAAAQKIDPAISDIEQAEAQLDRALAQKGLAKGRFGILSAGLWRSVKSAPNVSVREMRYGTDGILTVVLAAPDAGSVNKALIAIQQDGYRVTATPRQDTTGATLVDLTMRIP